MSHFILHLPSGATADVRAGWIFRKRISVFFWKPSGSQDRKRAYFVKLGPSGDEYRLLRTIEGKWLSDGVPGFQPTEDTPICLALKEAILLYER